MVIPLIKYLDASKNTIKIGIKLITLPAIKMFHSVAHLPCSLLNPIGSVIRSLSLVMISGHKKLFHEAMKAKIANVAIAGLLSGRIMLINTRT